MRWSVVVYYHVAVYHLVVVPLEVRQMIDRYLHPFCSIDINMHLISRNATAVMLCFKTTNIFI